MTFSLSLFLLGNINFYSSLLETTGGFVKIALYDHQQLIYDLGVINWRDNGHRTGEFYLRNLQHSIGRDRIVDLGMFSLRVPYEHLQNTSI